MSDVGRGYTNVGKIVTYFGAAKISCDKTQQALLQIDN
jgi:hypothetical protein